MIRAVLDANVFVSGFPAHSGPPSEIIRYWLRRTFHLIVSEHILREVANAWTQPYFRARYSAGEAEQAIELIRSRATLVGPDATVRGVATHSQDDAVLGTARNGGAAYLVTGDAELRRLSRLGGTEIMTPREFLNLLEHQAPGPV